MPKLHYGEGPNLKDKQAFAKWLSEDEELILAIGYGKAYLRSRFIIFLALPGMLLWFIGIGIAYVLGIELIWGLLAGFILSIILALLKMLLQYHSHRYLLTTRRVIIKNGFFAVQLRSALFDKITHIEVDQSFVDKVLYHHGKVTVNTAGVNKTELDLDFVDYPIEFKNLLERLINRQRERYGIRPGPVETIEGDIVE